MSDPSPFSNDSLSKAVKGLEDAPKNQIQLGVVKTADDQGIELEGEKDFKVGDADGFAAGDVSWFQKTKWKVAGWVGLKWK